MEIKRVARASPTYQQRPKRIDPSLLMNFFFFFFRGMRENMVRSGHWGEGREGGGGGGEAFGVGGGG